MKKVVLFLGLLLGLTLQAQEETNQKKNLLSVELGANVGGNLGITYERESDLTTKLFRRESKFSNVAKIYMITHDLSYGSESISGTGFGVEWGRKRFFNKQETKGFYFGSRIMAGSIYFDGYISSLSKFFEGRYSYLSFLAPDLGYKLLIAEKISVDLHLGTAWLIEIKGKGDVDNKDFNNWVFRGGLLVGYRF